MTEGRKDVKWLAVASPFRLSVFPSFRPTTGASHERRHPAPPPRRPRHRGRPRHREGHRHPARRRGGRRRHREPEARGAREDRAGAGRSSRPGAAARLPRGGAGRETERAIGPIGILVNNSATNLQNGPALEATYEQLDKMVEINLKSAFRLVTLVAPGMIARGDRK